ncbi:MAG: hypothetical protein KJ077_21785 [Anaerolineae bacterium]|nr:hypothetical protein [Anaerolineae bacterium]
MTKDSPDSYSGPSNKLLYGEGIPGVETLGHTLIEAHEEGVLFFLAVEIELLLKDYLKKNGLPPTPIDLEIMIAEAAKAMLGE